MYLYFNKNAILALAFLLVWRTVNSAAAACCNGACQCQGNKATCADVADMPDCSGETGLKQFTVSFAANLGAKQVTKAMLDKTSYQSLISLWLKASDTSDSACNTGTQVTIAQDAFTTSHLSGLVKMYLTRLCGGSPPARLIQDATFKASISNLRINDDESITAFDDDFFKGITGPLAELKNERNALQSAKYLRVVPNNTEEVSINDNKMLVLVADIEHFGSGGVTTVMIMDGDEMSMECGVPDALASVNTTAFPAAACVNATTTATTTEAPGGGNTGGTTTEAPGGGNTGGGGCDETSSPPSPGGSCVSFEEQLFKFF